jgi:hypothetical protein
MTDTKKTDPETPDPIGPGASMVDAVSPYLRPKPGWVLAPQARRRPPSFTAPPAQGRSRLLQDGNFVGLPHFADNYEHELLLPPGVAEQFKKLKQRLEKEAADSAETDQHGKHVGGQEDPAQRERAREQERERERQSLLPRLQSGRSSKPGRRCKPNCGAWVSTRIRVCFGRRSRNCP